MDAPTQAVERENVPGIKPKKARLLLRGVQLAFLIISMMQLNAPFLTAHNERQNQTYDIARHVFENGWSAVWTPEASFSLTGYEARPYTVVRQEFPFHGVLGWPFVKWFGHDRAVVRLISVFFALFSIEFIYLILQRWLNPASALIGATLWACSPLVLQFGQVPMPDILCTAGMLGAFWFALKPNLPASSAWFLFAILAKVSVIFFGLPILTMLWFARDCRSFGQYFRTALLWGIAPLIGLLCWTSLEIRDPDTPWTVVKIVSSERGAGNLHALKFYIFLAGSLVPYGMGVLGLAGCIGLVAAPRSLRVLKPAVMITILISLVLYVVVVVAKIAEPQYILPLLAWLVIAAVFGLNAYRGGGRSWGGRAVMTTVIGLHILVLLVFTADLKSSHIPDLREVQAVAKLIPPGSRVLAAYPFYGASPAIWLGQNVYAVHYTNELATLPEFEKEGYDYLLIMDFKSHTPVLNQLSRTWLAKAVRKPTASADAGLTDFAAPGSPFRRFCDGRFEQLYSTRYVVLYSLAPDKNQ